MNFLTQGELNHKSLTYAIGKGMKIRSWLVKLVCLQESQMIWIWKHGLLHIVKMSKELFWLKYISPKAKTGYRLNGQHILF